MIATFRQMGISLGMAVAGSIYANRFPVHQAGLLGSGFDATEAARKAIPQALHDVIVPAGFFLMLAVLFDPEQAGGSRNTGDESIFNRLAGSEICLF